MKKIPEKVLAFAKEVRRRREAIGMTTDEYANAVGIGVNYLGSIERGRRDPSLWVAANLAAGLGITLSELLGGKPLLSAVGLEAAQLYDAAGRDVQVAIVSLLDAKVNQRPRAPRKRRSTQEAGPVAPDNQKRSRKARVAEAPASRAAGPEPQPKRNLHKKT